MEICFSTFSGCAVCFLTDGLSSSVSLTGVVGSGRAPLGGDVLAQLLALVGGVAVRQARLSRQLVRPFLRHRGQLLIMLQLLHLRKESMRLSRQSDDAMVVKSDPTLARSISDTERQKWQE